MLNNVSIFVHEGKYSLVQIGRDSGRIESITWDSTKPDAPPCVRQVPTYFSPFISRVSESSFCSDASLFSFDILRADDLCIQEMQSRGHRFFSRNHIAHTASDQIAFRERRINMIIGYFYDTRRRLWVSREKYPEHRYPIGAYRTLTFSGGKRSLRAHVTGYRGKTILVAPSLRDKISLVVGSNSYNLIVLDDDSSKQINSLSRKVLKCLRGPSCTQSSSFVQSMPCKGRRHVYMVETKNDVVLSNIINGKARLVWNEGQRPIDFDHPYKIVGFYFCSSSNELCVARANGDLHIQGQNEKGDSVSKVFHLTESYLVVALCSFLPDDNIIAIVEVQGNLFTIDLRVGCVENQSVNTMNERGKAGSLLKCLGDGIVCVTCEGP